MVRALMAYMPWIIVIICMMLAAVNAPIWAIALTFVGLGVGAGVALWCSAE